MVSVTLNELKKTERVTWCMIIYGKPQLILITDKVHTKYVFRVVYLILAVCCYYESFKMENGNVEMSYANESFINEKTDNVAPCRTQYGVPENYNPADHPAVKLRNHSNVDRSETQRKRRSKNRLSNRRSTGFVNQEIVEEALQLGPKGTSD